MKYLFIVSLLLVSLRRSAQTSSQADFDPLENEILKLRTDINQLQLNLTTSHTNNLFELIQSLREHDNGHI